MFLLSEEKNKIFMCVCMYIYKLTTVVKVYLKAPFSIATTLRCRGGRNSFPWIAPLYS